MVQWKQNSVNPANAMKCWYCDTPKSSGDAADQGQDHTRMSNAIKWAQRNPELKLKWARYSDQYCKGTRGPFLLPGHSAKVPHP